MIVRSYIAIAISALMALTVASIPVAVMMSQLPGSARWVGGAVGVLVVSVAVLRSLRLVLVVDEQGVVVKNYFETMRLEWSQIEEVCAANTSLWIVPASAVAFEFGSRWRIAAAQASVLPGRRTREQLLRFIRGQIEREGIPCRLELAPDGSWSTSPATDGGGSGARRPRDECSDA